MNAFEYEVERERLITCLNDALERGDYYLEWDLIEMIKELEQTILEDEDEN